jgi:hypothetical protein
VERIPTESLKKYSIISKFLKCQARIIVIKRTQSIVQVKVISLWRKTNRKHDFQVQIYFLEFCYFMWNVTCRHFICENHFRRIQSLSRNYDEERTKNVSRIEHYSQSGRTICVSFIFLIFILKYFIILVRCFQNFLSLRTIQHCKKQQNILAYF